MLRVVYYIEDLRSGRPLQGQRQMTTLEQYEAGSQFCNLPGGILHVELSFDAVLLEPSKNFSFRDVWRDYCGQREQHGAQCFDRIFCQKRVTGRRYHDRVYDDCMSHKDKGEDRERSVKLLHLFESLLVAFSLTWKMAFVLAEFVNYDLNDSL